MQLFADVGQWCLFVLGAAVVLLTLFDVTWTVIAAAVGRGPLLPTHHGSGTGKAGVIGA